MKTMQETSKNVQMAGASIKFSRWIGSDLARSALLVTSAMLIALFINSLRDQPVPLVYQSQDARLATAVSNLKVSSMPEPRGQSVSSHTAGLVGDEVGLTDFKEIVDQGRVPVLDARPEIFYRLGHVPGALSLPRDDFEAGFSNLPDPVKADKGAPVVVYCSNRSCRDSHLVASALEKLGFSRVVIFVDGWSAWQSAGYSEEVVR